MIPESSFPIRSVHPLRALRLALRGLLRSPGTAAAAVLTLSVGLGVTVTLLGVIQGMFRPLPVPEGQRVVRVEVRDRRARSLPVTPQLFRAVGAPIQAMEALEAIRPFTATLTGEEGFAHRIPAAAMTPGTFRLLRVSPLLGRHPSTDPSDLGSVVLGHRLWQDRFGASSEAVGSTLRVDGELRTVVGIMPEGFAFPYRQELWVVLDPDEPEAWAGAELVGRLSPRASTEGAGAAMQASLPTSATVGNLGSGPGGEHDPDAVPARVVVREFVGGRGESGEVVALAGLSVLVGLLLLIAAANASTLLLVRATERSGTMALHAALGAPRSQVALQLLGEAAWVALAGGALGIALGAAILGWVESNLSLHWGYYWMRMGIQPAVVAWTVGIVLVTAVLAGTAPALRAMRTDLTGVLTGRGTGSMGAGPSSLGRWFLGVQVALSTAGLVAAVFLGAGVLRSRAVAERLPLDDVVVATVPLDVLSAPRSQEPQEAAARELVRALRESLAGLGQSTALSVGVPGFGSRSTGVEILGIPDEEPARATFMAAGPGLFETYGLSMVRGRSFQDQDGPGAPPVAVVNESFVRRFLTGEEPLETLIHLDGIHEGGEFARVIGVVQDHFPDRPGLRADRVYLPLSQQPISTIWISVRGGGPAGQIGQALRQAVRSVDPSLPVEDVRTLRDLMDYIARIPRTIGLFGLMGGLAGVAVAAIGLFGVVSYQVRTRFPELGVRMALGAGPGRILREVVGQGVRRVLPGLAVGLGLGALMSPLLVAFLFGFSPATLAVYVGVGAGMLGVGILASLGPALRAARLDPLVVLRDD